MRDPRGAENCPAMEENPLRATEQYLSGSQRIQITHKTLKYVLTASVLHTFTIENKINFCDSLGSKIEKKAIISISGLDLFLY